MKNIKDSVSPTLINLKSFYYKNILNPMLWIKGSIEPTALIHLKDIANAFIETLELNNLNVIDIVLVGSMASYNWSKYSDMDIHVILDYSTINNDLDLVTNFLDLKKTDWNRKHTNLRIFGYDVELYTQDIHEYIKEFEIVNGIYSIKYNRWVKTPTGGSLKMNEELIKKHASILINTINYYYKIFNKIQKPESLRILRNKVKWLYKNIADNRKAGLHTEGEGSVGNIVFKILRRHGDLLKLKDLKILIFDKIHNYK